jgi:hypothetical protein
MIEARPHPTLVEGRDDYSSDAYFKATLFDDGARVDEGVIVFKVDFDCNVRSINAYINRGNLKYGLRLKCLNTSFFQLFESAEKQMEVNIPAEMVEGRLELEACIFAPKEFDSFAPGPINSDYEQQIFSLPKGSQVAICPLPIIPINHDIVFNPPLNSIIDIRKSQDEGELSTVVDKNQNRLTIILPVDAYDAWFITRSNRFALRDPLANILVFPVLVDAVYYLLNKNNDQLEEELNETKWARQLDHFLQSPYSLQELRTNRENVYSAIENLLSNPVRKTLLNLKEFAEMSDPQQRN